LNSISLHQHMPSLNGTDWPFVYFLPTGRPCRDEGCIAT
jgi:hypothetical protein